MPGPRMQYASIPSYQYQKFDLDFVKFTNIPFYHSKKPKEEPPAAQPVEEKKEEKEEAGEASGELQHL